ncbi:MAG: isopentenyl-diphosphate Delta-isomerase [Beijerinckiaceae bacterium]
MIDEDEAVVLVDAQGRDCGTAPKLKAHVDGLKHRAISVLIGNEHGELLLQRRFRGKYHSGGLWTNACCSHPRPGEAPAAAAVRRLRDEMGFTTVLSPLFVVEYRAQVGALIEDEYVHVFGGAYDGAVNPDAAEVEDYKWISVVDMEADMASNPDRYTAWFLQYMRVRRDDIAAFAESVRRH